MDAFVQHERARLKAVLDATSDFTITGSRVTFAQHFEAARARADTDQSRALRNAVASSDV